MEFSIAVWYRYVSNREQEKEIEVFKVNALGVHDAYRIICDTFFGGNKYIPFKYGQMIGKNMPTNWYNPFKVNIKDEAYNEPIDKLHKIY